MCCFLGPMMRIPLLYISHFCTYILCVHGYGSPCDVFTTVTRRVEKQGFHRDLHSEVEIVVSHSSPWEECELLVQETMPSGLYVDPDQLFNLRQAENMQAFTPDIVDIERPEHVSTSHTVFVYSKLNKTENLFTASFSLPFHVRYHKPVIHHSLNDGYASVSLGPPQLYLKCSEDSLDDKCVRQLAAAPCSVSVPEKCKWIKLPFKSNSPTIMLSVPVGNMDHYHLVTTITLMVSFGSCIYLLLTLRKV